MRCYAPIAIALVTTEESPVTVRRQAEGSGVFVFASSDLFYLLWTSLKEHTVAAIRDMIKKEGKTVPTLIWAKGLIAKDGAGVLLTQAYTAAPASKAKAVI